MDDGRRTADREGRSDPIALLPPATTASRTFEKPLAAADAKSEGQATGLTALFALAVFLGSLLLFLAEPIAGKRLLPLLGGSAAVWTTCLVFFQTVLLFGYCGAHLLATRVAPRRQAVLFVAVLVLCLAQLAVNVNLAPHASVTHPIASVLWLLTLLIGVPFLALSATSPLLQSWYARSMRRSPSGATKQPYKLFALSNAGSLIALVLYPFLIEPRLTLGSQRALLLGGFVAFALVCAVIASRLRRLSDEDVTAGVSAPSAGSDAPAPRRGEYALWIALAACGSLLLSAVTNHLSQNVAAVPLLWIVPLVAYLLSFIVAFAGGEKWRPRWLVLGVGVIAMVIIARRILHSDLSTSLGNTIALYCAALFGLCFFCHAELHRLRPAARHLTSFYVSIATGGAIGAFAVGVAAPIFLPGNYELTIGLALTTAVALAAFWSTGLFMRSLGFAAIASTITVVYRQVTEDRAYRIFQLRDFYGTLQVAETVDENHVKTRTLYHGTIEHGNQIDTPALRDEPTTYYSRTSGVGLALDHCCGQGPRRVGVIGLGTGTIAAYGRPGDVFRYYEIDKNVEHISRTYFTYLRDSKTTIEIVPGDARISMEKEPNEQYDVIAVDAFSGDAIPVHLLTREALALYRRHLKPTGILAVHVSNRYLDLAPVVQQEAEHAGLQSALVSAETDTLRDGYSSDWVLVTANAAFMKDSTVAAASEAIAVPNGLRLWTDDYNSLLPILKRTAPND